MHWPLAKNFQVDQEATAAKLVKLMLVELKLVWNRTQPNLHPMTLLATAQEVVSV